MSQESTSSTIDQHEATTSVSEVIKQPYEKPVLHILPTSGTRNSVASGSDGTRGS